MRRLSHLATTIVLLACIARLALGQPSDHSATVVEDRGRAACDYGIAIAFHGDLGRAESVFIRLLVRSPGDARALTNLGNLNLMRGEPAVAMAFYERAARADTADAGILLDQATALLLLGDDDAARAQAAIATERAGGVREAARLLGLRTDLDEATPRAAEKTRVGKEEILSLLRAAAAVVPTDSLPARRNDSPAPESKAPRTQKRRAPVWRAAGARAGDQDVAAVLYWKRGGL
jgi:Flp pilus assembly protein TadD